MYFLSLSISFLFFFSFLLVPVLIFAFSEFLLWLLRGWCMVFKVVRWVSYWENENVVWNCMWKLCLDNMFVCVMYVQCNYHITFISMEILITFMCVITLKLNTTLVSKMIFGPSVLNWIKKRIIKIALLIPLCFSIELDRRGCILFSLR
jgi:hypothetical protein